MAAKKKSASKKTARKPKAEAAKRGRPNVLGETVMFSCLLPVGLMAKIDAAVKRSGTNRADVVRRTLEARVK